MRAIGLIGISASAFEPFLSDSFERILAAVDNEGKETFWCDVTSSEIGRAPGQVPSIYKNNAQQGEL